MNQGYKDALAAVEELNESLYEKYGDECPMLSVVWAGNCYTFIGLTIGEIELPIWNSENDERKFDEDSNSYEPLKEFISRKYNEIKTKLSAINI